MTAVLDSSRRTYPARKLACLALVGVTVLSLAGCGAGAPPSPAPTPAATVAESTAPLQPASPAPAPLVATPLATPVPTPAPAFTNDRAALGPIVWATAVDATTNAPASPVTTFAIFDRTLYAVVLVERVASGTELAATWRYNATSLDGFDQRVVADHDGEMAYVEFHLTRSGDEPWPDGVYEIAVTVDQAPALSAAVEVR